MMVMMPPMPVPANHANIILIVWCDFQAGALKGLFSSTEGELCNTVCTPCFSATQQRNRIKVLYFARKSVVETGRIKQRNRANARDTIGCILPCFFNIITSWTQNAHACNDYSPLFQIRLHLPVMVSCFHRDRSYAVRFSLTRTSLILYNVRLFINRE